MDQLISAAGEKDHALLIDCRSLETRAVAIAPDVSVVVLDTATRRGLVDSAYNERRARCEEAARFFSVAALRDVDQATFDARSAGMDPITRKRAKHVIAENARTVAAADALACGDADKVGTLMNESHASLRDDFEVSGPELDMMVELARAQEGCHGARMTGAGFAGCAVALVSSTAAPRFATSVAAEYARLAGRTPAVYLCAAAAGASLERV
jgi:galactokinase